MVRATKRATVPRTATQSFHDRIKRLIKKIPKGRVASYGQIATMAGNSRGARQVVRALHSSSEKDGLPWHRVINGQGKISLPRGGGYELQRELLESEGVMFSLKGLIDLERFRWSPRGSK